MLDENDDRLEQMDQQTRSAIDRKAQRRIHARESRSNAMWYGLGTMGVVGWSVAVPTLIGLLIGFWLEENVAVSFSWVLTGLIVGVLIGCLNAWYWISTQRKNIQARRAKIKEIDEEDDEEV